MATAKGSPCVLCGHPSNWPPGRIQTSVELLQVIGCNVNTSEEAVVKRFFELLGRDARAQIERTIRALEQEMSSDAELLQRARAALERL